MNQKRKGRRLLFLKSRQEPFKNVSKLLRIIRCKTSARKELAGFSRLFKYSIDHDSEKHIANSLILPQTSCTLETISHTQPAPNGAGVQGPWTPLDPSTDHSCRRNDRLTHCLQESSSKGYSLRKGPALGGRQQLRTLTLDCLKSSRHTSGEKSPRQTSATSFDLVSHLPSFPKLIHPRPGSCCSVFFL